MTRKKSLGRGSRGRFGGGQVDTGSSCFPPRGLPDRRRQGRTGGQRRDPVGNGPDALTGVTMIGFSARRGVGTCGKDGQSAPVGVGQPTLRMDGLIGGTGA